MGIGMQIVYLGFAGAARIEAEAAVQLLRLERFGHLLGGCHLAIEQMRSAGDSAVYDVRLDLILRNNDLIPLPHCAGASAEAGLRTAFDRAERLLSDRDHAFVQAGR